MASWPRRFSRYQSVKSNSISVIPGPIPQADPPASQRPSPAMSGTSSAISTATRPRQSAAHRADGDFRRRDCAPLRLPTTKIAENAGWDRERLAIEIPDLAGLLETEGLDVTDLWGRTLRRRSQKDRMTWARMTQLVDPGSQTAPPTSLAERSLCRHTPEVGAVCGKAARTVLCGGRSAMSDLVQHVGDGKARMAQRLTRARPGTALASLRHRCPGRSDLGSSLYHPMEVGGYNRGISKWPSPRRSRRGSPGGTGSKVDGLPLASQTK